MDKFARRSELRLELDTLNREIFADGCKDIFESIPEVSSFSWTQYSPYFNDGDECVFGVNEEPRRVTINDITFDPQDLYISTSDYDSETRKYVDKDSVIVEASAANEVFEDDDGEDHKFSDLWITYARYTEIINAIESFLSSQDEWTMQDTFGNHVMVTLNSDGTSSDESYDHD